MSEHRCDHQFCPLCIERVKREDARVMSRNIIGVYQMDGQRYDVSHSEGGYRIENLETGLRSVQMSQDETERVLRDYQYQKVTNMPRNAVPPRFGWKYVDTEVLDLPQGYEIVDGQIQPRHMTGQFCDCDECEGVAEDETPVLLVDRILAYEQDELGENEIIELFAVLVETGMAWQLQGSYGRTAMALIEAGLIGARV